MSDRAFAQQRQGMLAQDEKGNIESAIAAIDFGRAIAFGSAHGQSAQSNTAQVKQVEPIELFQNHVHGIIVPHVGQVSGGITTTIHNILKGGTTTSLGLHSH
jgi:methyl coenzyme M reductase subunit C